MKKLLLILLLLAVGVLVLATLAVRYVEQFGERPIAATATVNFEIASGSSFRRVVDRLAEAGVLDEPLLFRLYVRNRQAAGRIQAGEYRFEPGISHQQLLQALVSGKVLQHQVTLVEGQRLRDFLSQLQQHEAVTFDLPDSSLAAVAKVLALPDPNPEGWIYPDTYHFPRATTASALLRAAYARMRQVLEEEWAQRSAGLPIETPYEALILASIIEKETGAAQERETIAGVFIRRLQKGMRLQTDPTVIYGMGESFQGGISRRDLRRETPYNTYQISGLPPTPIASPAREAIHAALHPAAGKALYFVAKGDGTHYFSSTLREHNRAVEKYQRSGRRHDYRSAPAASESSGS